MAESVASNFFLSVGGVDLSDHVRSLTLSHEGETVDITAMGDTSREMLGGLKSWSMEVEFNQDFAAAKVDATLFPLLATTVALVFRPDTGAVSATNPEFTGNAILTSYPPLAGSVGDAHVTSVSFTGSGDLARATA
jgi:predicted secreted protein